MIKRTRIVFCSLSVIILIIGLIISNCSVPVEAKPSSTISNERKNYSSLLGTSINPIITSLPKPDSYAVVSGRTYRVTVKDFGGKTTLGVIKMNTKIYYGSDIVNKKVPGYVECKISVEPNVIEKKPNSNEKLKVGIPRTITVRGRFGYNANQVAFPKKENNKYQLSSSSTTDYSLSGSINLVYGGNSGFQIGGSFKEVSTTSISYPATVISYSVNNKTGTEGLANWEHRTNFSLYSAADQTAKTIIIDELSSSMDLYDGLSGWLNLYTATVSDYRASGYRKDHEPGTVLGISWDASNVVFDLGTSFGVFDYSAKRMYSTTMGEGKTELLRVK